jgi:YVTN family beta-propeller protein
MVRENHHSGSPRVTRRELARMACGGSLLAGAVSCGSRKGTGYPGYAFVANQDGRSVAAVDLTAFAVTRHIPLDASPSAILAHPSKPYVYVLTPQTGSIQEISAASFSVRRKLKVAAAADGVRLDAAGSLWVLCREARQLVRVDLESWHVANRVRLPGVPADMDLSRTGFAALSFPDGGEVGLVDLAAGQLVRSGRAGPEPRTVRFRSDGRQVLAGNHGNRTLSVIDAASGRLVVHLPLAVDPDSFCTKADGGALFVSGAGMDAVAMIFPYQSMVAETILAGRSPGAMAVTSSKLDLLFVANTESGDVTVIDINFPRVIAVVSAGARPGHISITPDDQYALVLNQASGDLAVIRIRALLDRGARRGPPPLFTLIPVGSRPVAAAIT